MTAPKIYRKGTRVVSHYRFAIRAVSPKSGTVVTFSKRKNFSERGPFKLYPTYAQADAARRRILKKFPQTGSWGMHVEEIPRKTRHNPSGYARARDGLLADMDKVAESYSAFSGRAATHETSFKVRDGKNGARAGFALGRLVAVTYRPERDGDPAGTLYEHKFSKSSQPLLVASDDGERLEMLGGAFQVTERGIEDR